MHTISVTAGTDAIRWTAPFDKMPWVHATLTDSTPSSASRRSTSKMVDPLAISSSRTMTSLPVTSPIMLVIRTWSFSNRCLAPAATGVPSIRENVVAVLALPRSGDTTMVFERSSRRKCSASSLSA